MREELFEFTKELFEWMTINDISTRIVCTDDNQMIDQEIQFRCINLSDGNWMNTEELMFHYDTFLEYEGQ